MTIRSLASREVQNNFGAVLDTAQREPVCITRRGRRVAVMVSAEEWQNLTSLRAVAWFRDYAERASRAMTPTTNELTDADVTQLVHELRA